MVLRARGYKFDEIARELGYADRSGARKAVERGRMSWAHESDEQLRARELELIEVLVSRLMPLVDSDEPDLKAMETLSKLIDRRARFLGLYGKRPSPPASYAGEGDRAGQDKARQVRRYTELADKL